MTTETKTKKNIAINGCRGRLGSLIVNLLNEHPTMQFIDIIPRKIPELFNKEKNVDIIIDVSTIEGTYELIKSLFNSEIYIPLIIGTTGHSDEHLLFIKKYSKYAPVALIPNFSKGIPLFDNFIKSIKYTKQWDAKLIDDHHILKKDSPSGTAKRLMSFYDGNINVSSIREGETIGTHTLILDSPTEQLIIKHIAKDRKIFAFGSLDYCNWIITQKAGFYTEIIDKNEIEIDKNIKFTKYENCGNDFIILNMDDYKKIDIDIVEFVKKYCNRYTSFGADGMIFVSTELNNVSSQSQSHNWIFYNCDGSIASSCGNGSLCCVKYLLDNNIINNKNNKICDLNDITHLYENIYNVYLINNLMTTQLKISPSNNIFVCYKFPTNFKEIIENDIFEMTICGVPHAVKFPFLWSDVYPENPLFDEKYIDKFNMNTINGIHIKNEYITIRTYELGVNKETLSCGTGCCAVAYSLYIKFGYEKTLIKTLSNKYINVLINKKNKEIYLDSQVTKCYEGYTK